MDPQRLREHVGRLRHDLGKYVAFFSANLPPEAFGPPPSAEAVEALRRDVLATRTGADGRPRTAWQVFDAWVAECGTPPALAAGLAEVAAAVDVLRASEPALRSGDPRALGPHVAGILAAQRRIRAALRELSRSLAHGAH